MDLKKATKPYWRLDYLNPATRGRKRPHDVKIAFLH